MYLDLFFFGGQKEFISAASDVKKAFRRQLAMLVRDSSLGDRGHKLHCPGVLAV